MTLSIQKAQNEEFLEYFQSIIAKEQEVPQSLKRLHKKGWEAFQRIGLPDRKTETYRYLPLNKLYTRCFQNVVEKGISSEEIQQWIYPECMGSVIVFVNGVFTPELSETSRLPKNVILLSLDEAGKSYHSYLSNRWGKTLKEEKDPFVLLNAACVQSGIFIYVPPKVIVETPIQILHLINEGGEESYLSPRIQVVMSALSQVTLAARYLSLNRAKCVYNCVTDVAQDAGSSVQMYIDTSEFSQESWCFDAYRATLKRDSKFKSVALTCGSETMRDDYHVILEGENAEASLNKGWLLKEKNQAHSHILLEHKAPHCRSFQLFKGVLSDTTRSSFEGKIYVHQIAQKTDAFQLNNNLVLSNQATAYSKPNLEIFADDVKASHGATVGKLDDEPLVYLRSRGIRENIAKNMLIHGFCQGVIDLIELPSFKKSAQRCVDGY